MTDRPKRALKRSRFSIYHYVDGERVDWSPPGVRGDLTGVSGNLSGVYGDLTDVSGDLTGVSGNLTDVSGDLDSCDLTPEMRERGVRVEDLIQ